MAPKPMPWFRFYVEAMSDRKIRRQKPEHRWLLTSCWAAARMSPEPGQLLLENGAVMTMDDLADMAALPIKVTIAGLAALEAEELLSFDAGVWSVPTWTRRQYESDSSSKRVADHRARNGDVTPNGTSSAGSMEQPPTEVQSFQSSETSSSQDYSHSGQTDDDGLDWSKVWKLCAEHKAAGRDPRPNAAWLASVARNQPADLHHDTTTFAEQARWVLDTFEIGDEKLLADVLMGKREARNLTRRSAA